MAAAIVQVGIAAGTASPGTSVAAAYGSNVVAGNRLVCTVRTTANLTLDETMVTDTQGNDWLLDFRFDLGVDGEVGIFSVVAGASAACTVTFNPASAGRQGIVIWEASGLAAYGSVGVGATATSTAPDSGAFTPAAATGIVFASITSSQTITWESDYGTGAVNDTTGRIWGAYDLAPAVASQTASGTCTSTTWSCLAAWYPDTAAAGGRIWKLAGDGGGLVGEARGLAG